MNKNIFQQQVVPVKPKVLENERIFVYVPAGGNNNKGILSVDTRDFAAPNGHVSLRWPVEMMIKDLADPTIRPSYVKVLPDEFIKTNETSTLTNPITGVSYQSTKAEIKLNRANRNAFLRPELVMLKNSDFEATQMGDYLSYGIKVKNPFEEPALVKLSSSDFSRELNGTIKIKWPLAHEADHYGLVKVDPTLSGGLAFDENNYLAVDIDTVTAKFKDKLDTKVIYTNPSAEYVDLNTNIALRNEVGNTLIEITKRAVGLDNVENRTFASRTYNEFGEQMKTHFNTQFGNKLDKLVWDGPTGLFRDWNPISTDRNTVQKWFTRLEEEDKSVWSSIRTLQLFLGFFENITELTKVYPANATRLGASSFIVLTNTYWAIKPISPSRYQFVYRTYSGLESIVGAIDGDRAVNLDNGQEFVWNGVIWVSDGRHDDQWQWYDTVNSSLDIYDFLETDKTVIQPNAPIANVSVGISGKLLQSDHIHPSDPGKTDLSIIEDSTITITSLPATANDFQARLVTITILDSDLDPIEATIVLNPEYLASIPSPTLNDYAITRNNNKVFQYNGSSWVDTNTLGTIRHNMNTVVNVPFVRTAQYLHNWKNNPTDFTQNEYSNEYYWAGSKAEFEQLDLDAIPEGAFLHVEDEVLVPGDLVLESQLAALGVTVGGAKKIVITTTGLNNLALTMNNNEIAAMDIANVEDAEYNMVVAIPQTGGYKLGKKSFDANKLIKSNANGDLTVWSLDLDQIPRWDLPSLTLAEDRIVISGADGLLRELDTGNIANRALASDGVGGVKVIALSANQMVVSDSVGGLSTIAITPANIIKSGSGSTVVNLTPGKLPILGLDNTIVDWEPVSVGVEGSLVVRGADDGTIKLHTTGNVNRLILSATNGTLQELSGGADGYYLKSNGPNAVPGWVPGPTSFEHLPQTKLISNPSSVEAVAFKGLVAVVLDSPPNPSDLRDNCIYYY